MEWKKFERLQQEVQTKTAELERGRVEMQARTNELERRLAEQEKSTKRIRFEQEQEQEQRFIMQAAALARKTEKETIDKTYESQGYPVNEDTTSLRDFTYWILSNANIQKHCVANMTRTDSYKTKNEHDCHLQRSRNEKEDQCMVSKKPRRHLPQ